jgi:hypothetical protein
MIYNRNYYRGLRWRDDKVTRWYIIWNMKYEKCIINIKNDKIKKLI